MKYFLLASIVVLLLLTTLLYSQIEGFVTKPIQGYRIPKPTIPTAPSVATDSQGGLVSIR